MLLRKSCAGEAQTEVINERHNLHVVIYHLLPSPSGSQCLLHKDTGRGQGCWVQKTLVLHSRAGGKKTEFKPRLK